MGFLQNIFSKGGKAEEVSELPTRNRTFSASAFREAEIARENETYHARQQQPDTSAVLSPNIAPVAEVLMSQQEPTDFAALDSELPSFTPPPSEVDPMHWEEAVGWLSQRSAASRNLVAQYWNWEHDLKVMEFLVQQPDLDPGVAAGVLWLTASNEDYFPWGDDEPQSDFDQAVTRIAAMVGRRFDAGDYPPMAHGFDDSWDCERLKERLTDLHGEGRIDWNPRDIPTSSVAQMMSFDDLPDDERQDVIDFLAQHGVR
ncbi:hypothetical protein [Sphingomonas jaspsi]|uniref:hypothetical protein n=1 Tax=Sphingomonas jaspsi TaxID=392409 RepID=UPI0004B96F28|nr:hypothetical protein [Sphingomonas jaspsi]